jgi:hypothetical protein
MQVITGQPKYVEKKIAQFVAQGYKVVKRHIHPDTSITVRLER